MYIQSVGTLMFPTTIVYYYNYAYYIYINCDAAREKGPSQFFMKIKILI